MEGSFAEPPPGSQELEESSGPKIVSANKSARLEEAAVDALLGVEKSWPTNWPQEESLSMPTTPGSAHVAAPPLSRRWPRSGARGASSTATNHRNPFPPDRHHAALGGAAAAAAAASGTCPALLQSADPGAAGSTAAGTSKDHGHLHHRRAVKAPPFLAAVYAQPQDGGDASAPFLEVVRAPTSPKPCSAAGRRSSSLHSPPRSPPSPSLSPPAPLQQDAHVHLHPQQEPAPAQGQQRPPGASSGLPSHSSLHALGAGRALLSPRERTGRHAPLAESPSAADLQPSVLHPPGLMPAKPPPLFVPLPSSPPPSTAPRARKPSAVVQSVPGSPMLQLNRAAMQRASLPSRAALADMQDPINILLDHFNIASALDKHNSALLRWHTEQRDKRLPSAKGSSTNGDSSSMLASPASHAGHRRLGSHSSMQGGHSQAFTSLPVGAFISHPEYSFAGSQPLKSERTGCVLYERHTPSDPSLPPVQRGYLRGRKPLLQQQQKLLQGDGGGGSGNEDDEAGGLWEPTSTLKSQTDAPKPQPAKALPNGVPLSRLDHMHAVEDRVAALMQKGTAERQQQLAAGREGWSGSNSRATPTQSARAFPPHLSASLQASVAAALVDRHAAAAPGSARGPAASAAAGNQSFGSGASSKGGRLRSSARSLAHGSSTTASPGASKNSLLMSRGLTFGNKAGVGRSAAREAGGSEGAGGGEGGSKGNVLLSDGAATSEAFGVARTLKAGTAEPLLDEHFYRAVHNHFLNLTGQQTEELQGDLNTSLPEIIASFGIASHA